MTAGRLSSYHCHIALGLQTPHSLKKSGIINFCKFCVIILRQLLRKNNSKTSTIENYAMQNLIGIILQNLCSNTHSLSLNYAKI